ncbi:MAG TPA: exodeoxyribonuclease VII large subunit, partial [Rhizomicrobium sp.]|nr:exodeoxyribonuclease VII large subunit [Rhizomicrobium sp.]
RAESLFAGPRQRLDTASDKLQNALRRNLQIHQVRFGKATARLRDGMLKDRLAVYGERTAALSARATRAEKTRLAQARQRLEGVARELELISYRSVLERGFALVRSADGVVRRSAASLKPGEALTLTFADGDASAQAGEGGSPAPAKTAKKKQGTDQGSLF